MHAYIRIYIYTHIHIHIHTHIYRYMCSSSSNWNNCNDWNNCNINSRHHFSQGGLAIISTTYLSEFHLKRKQ